MTLQTLQNAHWQAGILPKTGGSIAFARMRYSGAWVDILRATAEEDYDNASHTSSFLMLPWANRIHDGVLHANGTTHQLKTTSDDGTARHGDVRKREWTVRENTDRRLRLELSSRDFDDFNFPYALRAELLYTLDDTDFIWEVTLHNEDDKPFPAGFGFHPYFMHHERTMPLLRIPCGKQFNLENGMAYDAPEGIDTVIDFRRPRAVTDEMTLDNLLTGCDHTEPIRLRYVDWHTEIEMHLDPLFQHVMVFTAPDGTLAVEPQTNANNGFALYADGIDGSGVFEIPAGASQTAAIRLRIAPFEE